MVSVISLGGSIVAPSTGIDPEFLSRMRGLFDRYLAEDQNRRLVIVVGGGALARTYQNAARATDKTMGDASLDCIGIWATRLNAQLVRALLSHHCDSPIVMDPTSPPPFTGRILVAGGWKPGFSTDNVAVILAERLGAKRVLNLSNIDRVYTADPNKVPNATPIDTLSWTEYRKMVGDGWVPGKNSPFDPIASERAQRLELEVVNTSGTDFENLDRLLRGQAFVGTTIGPT